MWWWLHTAAAAEPCDPGPETFGALAAVLSGDAPAARAHLAAAEVAWGCSGAAEPEVVARWLLLDASTLELEGDPEAASDSWAAARALAPDTWLPDLGPERRARFDAAPPAQGAGAVAVTPAGRAVWIDGVATQAGPSATVPAGLHLVQVVDGDAARWAGFTFVEAGVTRSIETGLPPPAPHDPPTPPARQPVEPLALPPPPSPGPSVVLRASAGASVAVGGELRADGVTEPSTKVVVPLLASASVPVGPAFVRGEVGAGVLFGGSWLSTTAAGEVASSKVQWLASAAAGVGDRLRGGVAGGVAWPARLTARALAGWDRGPVSLELRGGVNLPTERPPEPAGELLVAVRLGR